MSDVELTGGCLCGAVRYRVTGAEPHFDACHCSMCRRFSGGVFLAVEVPAEGLTWESGEDEIATHASSDWAERGFCRRCGSSLFWRMPEGGMMALAAGTLDSLEGLEFASEIFIDRKPDAYAFAGERKRTTEAEVIAAFQKAGE